MAVSCSGEQKPFLHRSASFLSTSGISKKSGGISISVNNSFLLIAVKIVLTRALLAATSGAYLLNSDDVLSAPALPKSVTLLPSGVVRWKAKE